MAAATKRNSRVNILVLAASKGIRSGTTTDYPLCLSTFHRSTLLEVIVGQLKLISDANYSFVFLERQRQKFYLDDIVKQLIPDSVSIGAPEQTAGSACTALLMACRLPQDNELLIVSANEFVDIPLCEVLDSFRSRELDAGTVVFKSLNPAYSFVDIDTEGIVTETAQRRPISDNATTGIFWYSSTAAFVAGAKRMISKDANTEGQFFVAPVFNELVLEQMKVGVYEISSDLYTPLKAVGNDLDSITIG